MGSSSRRGRGIYEHEYIRPDGFAKPTAPTQPLKHQLVQEALRAFGLRGGEELLGWGDLHDVAGVHKRDAVSNRAGEC